MEQLVKILESLEKNTSRTTKEMILRNNADNEDLRKILYYVFNPYIIFGIGKKTFKLMYSGTETVKFDDIFDMLNYLSQNNTGTKEIKNAVLNFVNSNLEYADWIQRIVLKDLRCGIDAKTVNKVFGKGFCPTFEIMLAKSYTDYGHKIKGEFIITKKFDGVRCVVIVDDDGHVKFLSRQGQAFLEMVQLEKECKELPSGFVYDGELLLRNRNKLNSKTLYRETMKVVSKDGIKEDLDFHCFDMLPINSFNDGGSKVPCWSRKSTISQIVNANEFEWVQKVPILYEGDDKSIIPQLLKIAVDNGEEGIMVQPSDRGYECKRTDAILKCKEMKDCDLRVVSIEEGEGKNKGTLGRINCNYKGNVVGVGSGFSDAMRREIYDNQNEYIGKIAKIQYFEETQNSKDDKLSLRFPVFLEWRYDKDTESYN